MELNRSLVDRIKMGYFSIRWNTVGVPFKKGEASKVIFHIEEWFVLSQ